MARGPLEEKIRRLEAMLSVDPDNVGLRHELLRSHAVYLGSQPLPDESVAAAFQLNLEVLYALCPRDPAVTEAFVEQLDPAYYPPTPTDPEARCAWLGGLRELRSGHPDPAAELFRAALLAAPDAPLIHAWLAAALVETGSLAAARPHLAYAFEQAPESTFVQAVAGEAAAADGRLDEAFELLLTALAANPLCSRAEQALAKLGRPLGYTWRKLPLRPAVWPLIGADGQAWLKVNNHAPWAVRGAWTQWANAVLARCASLPPELAPLAGLPRHLPLLQDVYESLLSAWRRRRWFGRRHPASADLDWLEAVRRAGRLTEYLLYAYLHPDLAGEFHGRTAAQPGGMAAFLRQHVIERAPRLA